MRRLGLLTLLALAGCAQIIGLEDREFKDPLDGGGMMDATIAEGGLSADGAPLDSGGGGDLSCERYCALAKERCKREQGVQLFTDDGRCMGVCEAYPKGELSNPTGNTLACRIAQLEKLSPNDPTEVRTYCPGAGPGGGAPPDEGPNAACGSNCVGFCRLRQMICPNEQAEAECLRKCEALPDTGEFNANDDFMSGADNIQCRLAHLSAAADYGRRARIENNPRLNEDRDNHCAHSNIKSSTQCDLKTDMAPNCTDFCRIVMTGCAGPMDKVYDDLQQCVNVCNALKPGTKADIMDNNVRCRRERAYDALQFGANPTVCEAAGPAPDTCGQRKCANYCELARAACQAGFDQKFTGATPEESLGKCRAECAMYPDIVSASFYSVASGMRAADTFACRLRQTAIAFGDARACDSALGLPTGVCKN